MAKLIFVALVVIWYFGGEKLLEKKFCSRTTPPDFPMNFGEMSKDLANGMSDKDVMNKTMRGGYDVPIK